MLSHNCLESVDDKLLFFFSHDDWVFQMPGVIYIKRMVVLWLEKNTSVGLIV